MSGIRSVQRGQGSRPRDVDHRPCAIGSAEPEFYLPLLQTRLLLESPGPHAAYVTLVARAQGEAATLVPSMRVAVHTLAPDVTVSDVQTMTQVVNDQMTGARFLLVLLDLFAGAALVLACIGVHGVMSYAVSIGRKEIGIRIALGATPGQVVGGVMRDGMRTVLAGTAVGVILACGVLRALGTLWFGVEGLGANIATCGLVAVLLCAVALVACYLPARRASHLSPLEELR